MTKAVTTNLSKLDLKNALSPAATFHENRTLSLSSREPVTFSIFPRLHTPARCFQPPPRGRRGSRPVPACRGAICSSADLYWKREIRYLKQNCHLACPGAPSDLRCADSKALRPFGDKTK